MLRSMKAFTHRRSLVFASVLGWSLPAVAHHGWGAVAEDTPLYLSGEIIEVSWRNPHVELVLLPDQPIVLPPDFAQRSLPQQQARMDSGQLLTTTRAPEREEEFWFLMLGSIRRLQEWGLHTLESGRRAEVIAYPFAADATEPFAQVEWLFMGQQAYAMRSPPI